MRYFNIVLIVSLLFIMCSTEQNAVDSRVSVIFDSDANNELDDQHALAYLLFSGDEFDVQAITVNRTRNGGDIEKHWEEATRIVALCDCADEFTVLKGADGNFDEIRGTLDKENFDGAEAVDEIIAKAHQFIDEKLVLLPVGKLTNIALALQKDPSIIPWVRIVWLGSNYPQPGEYNQVNDENSLNYILDTDVEFEIALVRYGSPSGTAAVTASIDEIAARMPGKGPHLQTPVSGRHGNTFTNFGDYSINLFKNAQLFGEHNVRSLFDMAAVAIVKNPDWADKTMIPAPILVDGEWKERPNNPRQIALWENFDKESIMNDFYLTMENYSLAGSN